MKRMFDMVFTSQETWYLPLKKHGIYLSRNLFDFSPPNILSHSLSRHRLSQRKYSGAKSVKCDIPRNWSVRPLNEMDVSMM